MYRYANAQENFVSVFPALNLSNNKNEDNVHNPKLYGNLTKGSCD